jgi:hypothetical protein
MSKFRLYFLCVLGVLCGAHSLPAATPELNLILPRGGQRGTEVVVNFQGARLADIQEVVSYSPGFEFGKIETVNPTHIKVPVKIAVDCALGEHCFRLRGASGISTLRTFWVSALPIVDEVEPNNEFAKPQKIGLNQTVHGVITAEDVDYFGIDAKKGQRISVEIEGMRLGTAFFDPAIAILDAKRFELATADDVPYLGQDAALSVIIPEDGAYTIRVRESAYGGNGNCHYRLHVGTFPRPTAVFPPGGRPGDEIDFTFIGDARGPFNKKVKLPASASTGFGIYPEDADGLSTSKLPIRVVDLAAVNEVEPNNGPAQATNATIPCALHGIINEAKDHDHYRITAKKGQVFDIRCFARSLGSQLDPIVWVGQVGDGRLLAANDDPTGGTPDSYLRFTAPEDKDYIIGIRDYLYKGGPGFVYRIEITPVQPSVAVSLLKYGLPPTQERQVVSVPKGGRYAAVVNVERSDFGGEVEIGVVGLPAGLALQPVKVPPGVTQVPVLFEAKSDAPIAGQVGHLTVRPTDPNVKIPGQFVQSTELVYGFNNSLFAQARGDRLAMSVDEPLPFDIRIVEPKVPLIRNGVMPLKVIVERRDGYKAPITIVPLINPPGVAANSVTIPEGGSETTVTLTANNAAAIGKHQYLLMAVATVKDGPYWISSPFINLEVAGPPVTVALDRAAAEQGKSTEIRGQVAVAAPFAGTAKVQLVGLPAKVTAQPLDVSAEAKEIVIPVSLDAASPVGQHKNVICQVTLVQNGEPMIYTAGVGELRIDKPLPPKPNQPAAKSAAVPQPKTEKRLTRLEQLRKEQQEREKGEKP